MTMHVVLVGAYGSAGVAAAQELAGQDDVELTLIDNGNPGGGLCILRGCMPSKEVLSAGAHRYQARHDDRIASTPAVDLEAVVERKDEHTLSFAEHRREATQILTQHDNVEFLHDTAHFADDHTISVGNRTIEADYVVIATGSTVNVPQAITGINDIEYMSSADVLDATSFPETGVVVGMGAVGIELVPYLSEVGDMDLTVIDPRARPLGQADDAFGDRIADLYSEQFGIDLISNANAQIVEHTDDGGVRVHTEDADETEPIEADQLFLFTGRRPDVDSLELSNTTLDPEPGWVEDTMQASDDPRIFVIGDANGRDPILHVAKEQGFLAGSNVIAHSRDELLDSYEHITHRVLFTGLGIIPFAHLGHTEASAKEANYECIAVSRDASDDGVFETKDVPFGLAKLVVDSEDGTVLGYQGLHYQADAMAKMMQIIIETGMHVRAIPDRAYHPTTPEIFDGLLREASDRLG